MTDPSDGAVFLDPDASREYLASWQQRVEETAARAQAMSEQLDQLRTTAKDANGLAVVTIDSSGVMLQLELTERTQRYQPRVVADAVLAALREARMLAAVRAREIAVETMGPESLSARTIADKMQQQLHRPEFDGGTPGRTV